jgi:hypothetical protein
MDLNPGAALRGHPGWGGCHRARERDGRNDRREQDIPGTSYSPPSLATLAAVTRRAGCHIDVAGDAPISRRPHRLGARRSPAAADALTTSGGAADRSGPATVVMGPARAAPLKIAGVIIGLATHPQCALAGVSRLRVSLNRSFRHGEPPFISSRTEVVCSRPRTHRTITASANERASGMPRFQYR